MGFGYVCVCLCRGITGPMCAFGSAVLCALKVAAYLGCPLDLIGNVFFDLKIKSIYKHDSIDDLK